MTRHQEKCAHKNILRGGYMERDSCIDCGEHGFFPSPKDQDKCEVTTSTHSHVLNGGCGLSCHEAGLKTYVAPSPHTEGWDWTKELPILEHSRNCCYWINALVCDCNQNKRQKALFDLVVKALHQTREEVWQQAEDLVNQSTRYSPDTSFMNMVGIEVDKNGKLLHRNEVLRAIYQQRHTLAGRKV